MKCQNLVLLQLLPFCFLLLSVSTFAYNPVDNFLPCLSLNSDNATSITKVIYTPINSSYAPVLDVSIQNLRFLTLAAPKPVVIVTPVDVSQIQASVVCAKSYGLQLRLRSGGHDYEGLSYLSDVEFVILDMSNLRRIDVNAKDATAWVQSGATIGELYYRIAEKSNTLGFPAGVCPTVGVGGHFSGGGYGNMMRKYGLAADNVIDAYVVDSKGRLLDRASMGEDLFWAIRGGGGESFGVIVSWKVKLVPVPSTVTVFTVLRTLDQNATQLVNRWQYIANRLPEDLFIRVNLQSYNSPPNRTTTIQAYFDTLYLGGTDDLLGIMNARFPELGLTKEDCKEMSWIESTLYYAGFQGQPLEILLNRSSNTKTFFKNKSDYVQQPIPVKGLEGMWEMYFQEEPGVALMEWNPYGGRMDEISASSIPFPHRAGNIYNIQHITAWTNGGNEASPRHISWIRRFYAYMAAYVSKNPRSAYINYRDLDIGMNYRGNRTTYKEASVWGRKYFNGNYDRLVRVKTMVDPSNFFRNEQSIPPFYSVTKA